MRMLCFMFKRAVCEKFFRNVESQFAYYKRTIKRNSINKNNWELQFFLPTLVGC